MRLGILSLLCCLPLTAQFENLVTNDDGSVLYFSSKLRLRGSGQVDHRKLFVYDAAGLRLYMQRPIERTTSPDAAWPVSNYHSLEAVALDGSGLKVGVIARRDCYGGSGCLPTPKYRTELQGRDYRGRMSLSRNGRYALLWGDGSMIAGNSFIDLETGQSATWIAYASSRARNGTRLVSSDGTAVFAQDRVLRIFRLDGERRIELPAYAFDVAIDDSARTAVYQSGDGLYAVDLATADVRKLASGPAVQPSISNDGRVIVFLSETGKLLATGPDGGSRRVVFEEPSGVREFVLSGDGRTVYAVTGSGRLLRVGVDTGEAQELIGQTPALQGIEGYPVPGSAFAVWGSGLALTVESVAPPLPLALNGLELLLDGRPVPLQAVAPDRVAFQIPWDTSLGRHRLEVHTASNRFFENDGLDIHVSFPVFAQFVPLPAEGRYVLAAHQDFRGLVTPASPARSGEVIHLYMTGLGPTAPFVPTGEPAPSDTPAKVTTAPTCLFGETAEAEVLYAGLAPGLAGYYQVSIRIPEGVPVVNGDAILSCRPSGPTTGAAGWLPFSR